MAPIRLSAKWELAKVSSGCFLSSGCFAAIDVTVSLDSNANPRHAMQSTLTARFPRYRVTDEYVRVGEDERDASFCLAVKKGYRFQFYASDNGEPPHVHVKKDEKAGESSGWFR